MLSSHYSQFKQPKRILTFRPWFMLNSMTISDVVRDQSMLGTVAQDLHTVPRDELNQLVLFDFSYTARSDVCMSLQNKLSRYLEPDSASETDEEEREVASSATHSDEYVNCLRAAMIAKKIPETGKDFHELSEALRNKSQFCGALCWVEPRKRYLVIDFLRMEAKVLGYAVPSAPVEPAASSSGAIQLSSLRK